MAVPGTDLLLGTAIRYRKSDSNSSSIEYQIFVACQVYQTCRVKHWNFDVPLNSLN